MTTEIYDQILDEWSDQWFQYILANPTKQWNYTALSLNPNITFATIRKYNTKRWNQYYWSNNMNCKTKKWKINEIHNAKYKPNKCAKLSSICARYFSWEDIKNSWVDIEKHTYADWNNVDVLRELCYNRNVTWNVVCANPQIPWNHVWLSRNPNITWDIVCANPKKHWDFQCLSANSNITWEIICANPEIPWNYWWLSKNPNITWDIVQNNTNIRWDYVSLSDNPMTFAREAFIRKRLQEWFRKSALKEELMASVWHPRHFHQFHWMDLDTFDLLE